METKKIKVTVTPKKTADGRSFNTYKTYSKNGRAIDLKFRKDVKNVPDKNCFIVCNVDDMSLNTSGEYPVLWVRAIAEIVDLESEMAESNRKKLDDFFGSDD